VLPLPDRIATVRRVFVGLLVAALVAIVAFSNQFGRAQPTGAYRSYVPPPVLTNGCFPLPSGVELDFPHQVRTDGNEGARRVIVLQYDLIDEDEARHQLVRSFTRAGFRRLPGEELRFNRGDIGRVHATVTPLDVDDEALVRGTIELDLPATARALDDPHCRDPYVTKRFPDSFFEVD
jgi:hypothetical protein